MSIRQSVTEVDTDLERVEELHKELKIHRRKRNYQHKRIRIMKKERDALSEEVKGYVSQINDLKEKRNAANMMAQEFKTLRDTAVKNRDRAMKNDNKADAKRFDKHQNQYHLDMVSKTELSQEYHQAIVDMGKIYSKANKACSDKHMEMLEVRERSQIFHDDVTQCIEKIEAIKAKYDIDFVDFGGEEE